eukprot:6492495-Amphidinium_carterae.1
MENPTSKLGLAPGQVSLLDAFVAKKRGVSARTRAIGLFLSHWTSIHLVVVPAYSAHHQRHRRLLLLVLLSGSFLDHWVVQSLLAQ